jgi:hypothetical protein
VFVFFYLPTVVATQEYLTINKILEYLNPISDRWMDVASKLKLPVSVINSIVVSRFPNNRASLRKVVEWWFQYTANPHWDAIVQLLQGIIKSVVM